MVQTQSCFVQVPLHLHRRLDVHVVFEEASSELGMVVGLLQRDLDGLLHLVHSGCT